MANRARALPFQPPTRSWFEASFDAATPAQRGAFPAIASGASCLVLAPTGSGKTLAAFLAALDRLLFAPLPPAKRRCRVLYVSPLKALAIDVERNLRAPLAGITAAAEREGVAATPVTVEVRTGDTPAKDRARMRRTPPDVLVTTPESLYLLLTSSARAMLASVDTVIVDEIHSLVPSKRGAHLFLSLERLERLRDGARPLQRIGLSATQRPIDEAARLLGGFTHGKPRPVTIVDATEKRAIDVRVEVPVDDMTRLGEEEDVGRGSAAGAPARKSIWPSLYPRLVELVRAHRSTMLFVNSRRLAERLATALNEEAGEEIAAAHHGSLAREKRLQIEDRLKRGELPALVATSSLELGIDMGAVDLVLQIEAPPSIASGVQRIGRACHQVGGTPRGVMFPKYRGDLLPCAAAAERIRAGDVEASAYPRSPLDVVAQQVVAIVASSEHDVRVDDVYALIRGAAPFSELPRSLFEGVLDMLSGRYPSDDFAGLRPRVTWDRLKGTLRPRPGALRLAVVNGGTIPDRGLYGVFLASGDEKTSRRVGELDEEMVFESRVGEVFLLGSSSWRIEEITHDRVLVSPAPGEPGKMPFWHGDKPGRSFPFGEAIGALARDLRALPPLRAIERLETRHGLDERAAKNLVQYVREQVEATGDVPSDRTIVVERFPDELGDLRIAVLTPFGARVHAPWATAIVARLESEQGLSCDVVWSDDGMILRFPECDAPPDVALLFPSSDEIEALVVRSIGQTSMFASKFREAAARALLLPRRYPGQRTALWMQRKRASDLLSVASRFGSFPIVLEAYRECLKDAFDLPSLVEVLRRIEQREVHVVTADTKRPSPFASSLLFSFVAEFLYEGDAPLAERRAQALRVDPAQLRAVLGEAELRELLDPDAIEALAASLQRLDRRYPAKDADGVHDLLLSLGDLSQAEIRARAASDEVADGAVRELETERRAVRVRIAKDTRFVAVEDAARYRDALGTSLPRGLPDALLGPTTDALRDLVSRFARTHTPFVAEDVAARFGIGVAPVRETLERLVEAGKVVEGELLPGGRARELCDAEVLRIVRRRSLAKLRAEIEPVDRAVFGAFLPIWQGVATAPGTRARKPGREALLAVVEQLEGMPLVASVLEREILPARIEGYSPGDLDALTATGQVVWAGVEPSGPKDGRIALYLAEHEAVLARRPSSLEGELHAAIRAAFASSGALFFADLVRRVGGFPNDVAAALWDLVWAGEVTNDTMLPLRSFVRGEEEESRRSRILAASSRARVIPGTEGRWWLRSAYRDANVRDTDRATAIARSLLDRYGVLTREAVQAEGIPGGFSAIVPVLREMEERGQVRRGYFVAGSGAMQFALPGADDRLRACRDAPPDEPLVLDATDPANAYGAALPWPEREGARPQRTAHARVVVHRGALAAYLGRGEQSLLTFLPDDQPARGATAKAIAAALAQLVDEGGPRALLLATIDGEPPRKSAIFDALVEAGFVDGGKGLLRRKVDAPTWSERRAALRAERDAPRRDAGR